MMRSNQYRGPQHHLVVSVPPRPCQPVLTVELYPKWYGLWLVHAGVAAAEPIHFGRLDDGEGTPYVDHVPNPAAVRRFAERHGYVVDELAEDLIAGRWQNEVVSQ